MGIKIKLDESSLAGELRDALPKNFLRMWTVVIKNYVRQCVQREAEKSGGRSFWQREVMQSLHDDVQNDTGHVYSDSYIAEHIHTGGEIRPRTRRYLAIPVDRSARGESPKDYRDLFVLRKENRAYLAAPRKRGQPKVLWILKRSVNQRPRPWWPDDAAVRAETERFIREDL